MSVPLKNRSGTLKINKTPLQIVVTIINDSIIDCKSISIHHNTNEERVKPAIYLR